MKKLLFPLALSILIASCSGNSTQMRTDLEAANLKGKVMKVEKKLHNATGKAVCPGAESMNCNNSVFVYNEKGFLTETSEGDDGGMIMARNEYKYGSDGKLKEIIKYAGDAIKNRDLNTYENGLLKEVKVVNDIDSVETIYNYDYNGRDIVSGKVLNSSRELISSFKNEIQNGQILVQRQFDKEGKEYSVSKFTRNEKNDITEYNISTQATQSEYKVAVEYEYDENGNWIKQTQKFNGEIIAIILRTITYYNS